MAGLPALPNTPKIDTFNLKEIGLKIKIKEDSDIDDIEVDIDDIIEKWKINEKDLPRNGNFVTIGDKDYEVIGNLIAFVAETNDPTTPLVESCILGI